MRRVDGRQRRRRGRAPAKPKVSAKAATPRATAEGVVLTRDPEEKDSFPLPAGTRGAKQAPQPSAAPAAPRRKAKSAAGSEISPGAPSDAEIRAELKQMEKAVKAFNRGSRGSATSAVRAAVGGGGRAQAPIGAPDVIARIISGGNAIAKFPYVWGGGHGSFVDSGYDCSGSVSYALAAAGPARLPARLRPVREVGRARPRQVGHDLRERRPRLHVRRRAALRHERPRRPVRLALAERAALAGGLRGPPPARP